MKTFLQFLDEKEKLVKVYGTEKRNFSVVKPARPAKPVYSGLHVAQVWPVPRCGKPRSGVVGK
jgi:hypothetical protein